MYRHFSQQFDDNIYTFHRLSSRGRIHGRWILRLLQRCIRAGSCLPGDALDRLPVTWFLVTKGKRGFRWFIRVLQDLRRDIPSKSTRCFLHYLRSDAVGCAVVRNQLSKWGGRIKVSVLNIVSVSSLIPRNQGG